MKILIVKMFALGDVFVTTPIFELIKEKNPHIKVHHLVSDECKIVTENKMKSFVNTSSQCSR